MKSKTHKQKIFLIIKVVFILIMFGVISVFGINAYVKMTSSNRIISAEQASKLEDVDCILVLGCKVKASGVPSAMLKDRLTRAVELYELGVANKLLMTGDHGRTEYNEVGTMKQFAVDKGIASENVFMDHAGFSTYESIYRAKEIFAADKIVIVTQQYHLHRALYIAEQLGVEAYGVSSDYYTYAGQSARELREILARCKDFVTTVFKPEPTYLGEIIPISGSGDATND